MNCKICKLVSCCGSLALCERAVRREARGLGQTFQFFWGLATGAGRRWSPAFSAFVVVVVFIAFCGLEISN